MYVCISCVPGAHGGQKRTLGALELELQMTVTIMQGLGTNLGPLPEVLSTNTTYQYLTYTLQNVIRKIKKTIILLIIITRKIKVITRTFS